MTDDPDTPGPGYWEINVATLLDASRREHRVETPRIDLNYGVGRRIQLKFEVPWVRVREGDDETQTGAGNILATGHESSRETLKEPIYLLGRNARSLVAD